MTQDSIDKLKWIGVDLGPTLERFVGNEKLFLKCIRTFADKNDYLKLMDAINAGDPQLAFEASHALKGVVGNLGFSYLYEEIKVITEVFRARTMNYDSDNLNRIKTEYKKVIDTINSITE